MISALDFFGFSGCRRSSVFVKGSADLKFRGNAKGFEKKTQEIEPSAKMRQRVRENDENLQQKRFFMPKNSKKTQEIEPSAKMRQRVRENV